MQRIVLHLFLHLRRSGPTSLQTGGRLNLPTLHCKVPFRAVPRQAHGLLGESSPSRGTRIILPTLCVAPAPEFNLFWAIFTSGITPIKLSQEPI